MEVERAVRGDVDAGLAERGAGRLLVVDDEPEVAGSVGWLGAPAGEREKLVAHVDERHAVADAAAELELEEASVPGERVLDVVDFERDVVDPHEPGHVLLNAAGGGTLPPDAV